MISIRYFKGLPEEYESFLIEKYNSYITTCKYNEIYHPDYEIHYVLIYDDSKLTELLMFENSGDTTTCLNKLVYIDQNIFSEFTKFIFESFPVIKKVIIIFSYISYSLNKSFLFHRNHDYIINLPSTMDDYLSTLGHSTRKNIKNYRSRLSRDYPQANFVTKYGVEIEESNIDRIIQLNIARMKHKGIIPGRDNNDKINIHKFAQHYGVVSYVEIDGVIVAGNIAMILNKQIFGFVIAHDESFSKYDIAKICQLNLIQTCIEKGVSTFHLLWGDNDFKKRFLGEPHLLTSYYVYKTYSLDYMITRAKTFLSHILLIIRQSELTKPLREAIKSYRKNKWKKQEIS
ncbi:MAG TPA: GNAT family N-acetyltransferase [Paludibacter sp.]